MFEFNKLCAECEKLGPFERKTLLVEKSVKVLMGVKLLDLPFIDPVSTLAAFIVGSVVSDGSVSEKDYLYIYPNLVEAFGDEFDLAAIKKSYKVAKDDKKEIARHTADLISVINAADEELGADIIMLCLLITSVDGKVSLREKKYIKKLIKS